jgi:hypothetical protein
MILIIDTAVSELKEHVAALVSFVSGSRNEPATADLANARPVRACRLPSAVCRLPSAVCRLPSAAAHATLDRVMPRRVLLRRSSITAALLILACPQAALAEAEILDWGVFAGAGVFSFRNSLYADRQPDPPADLGDRWSEYYVKPWLAAEYESRTVTIFGRASFAYTITAFDSPDLFGGDAKSGDFDDAYVGVRFGAPDTGEWKLAGGRYTFQLANGFIISDGYGDGGSRGGLWSNARKAFRRGAHVQYLHSQHRIDMFQLERNDRPEFNASTRITGVNYDWTSPGRSLTLGGTFLSLNAEEYRAALDGARVYNLRAYSRRGDCLWINAEFVRQDNGSLLDATAGYVQGAYTYPETAWPLTFEYRYAFFEGDDPSTPANEAYDPLFTGFEDWGTWFQGEIAGAWFLSNSNLRSHMLRLTAKVSDSLRLGVSLFDFTLDQPGSYESGVTSADFAREIDLIVDWYPTDYLSVTFTLANANPGKALEEAFNRTSRFRYGMIYLGFAFD